MIDSTTVRIFDHVPSQEDTVKVNAITHVAIGIFCLWSTAIWALPCNDYKTKAVIWLSGMLLAWTCLKVSSARKHAAFIQNKAQAIYSAYISHLNKQIDKTGVQPKQQMTLRECVKICAYIEKVRQLNSALTLKQNSVFIKSSEAGIARSLLFAIKHYDPTQPLMNVRSVGIYILFNKDKPLGKGTLKNIRFAIEYDKTMIKATPKYAFYHNKVAPEMNLSDAFNIFKQKVQDELHGYEITRDIPGVVKLEAFSCAYSYSKNGNQVTKIFLVIECFLGDLVDVFNAKLLNLNQKKLIAIKLVECVYLLHQRDILHRDLKPENILLRDDLTPFIGDMESTCRTDDIARIQKDLGTTRTSSPEMANSWEKGDGEDGPELIQAVTTKAHDVFALGCTLHEILLGLLPWANLSDDQMAQTLSSYFKERHRFVRPRHLDSIQHVLQRMMDPNPRKRATIEDIYAIRHCFTSLPLMSQE